MARHTHTVSTRNLAPGDVLLQLGDRVVKSVKGNPENLGAALIRFADGSHFHAGVTDAHPIERAAA